MTEGKSLIEQLRAYAEGHRIVRNAGAAIPCGEIADEAADALTAAQSEADDLRGEVERRDALLRECVRWLPLLDSHEAGSTTDLLCDRINQALAGQP